MEGFEICKKLVKNGYQAYIVGGYPRDLYLGINTTDIDICTNARPEEIIKCFKKVDKVIEKFGTVIIDNVQITTFRKDISYKGHYPDVCFVDTLKEDLQRRDFTINTLCMDINGNYIDYFNASKDLDSKIIKTVGNPFFKIKEDPLRILRAIRFSVCLDFKIDETLKEAIKKYTYLIDEIPISKLKYEKEKILEKVDIQKFKQICDEWDLNRWEELC